MNTEPLVSIVLPTYNGAAYLAQSIQSCIDQNYKNFELIIIDDASTDSTPEIIETFASKDVRIRSIRHATNLKLPAALNTGFKQAKGQYYTWTSDDNTYRPNAIKRMIAHIAENPEVDIVYADYTAIDEDSKETKVVTVKNAEYLACGNPIGCCFLFRRDVYHTLGGYDERLFLVEDYHFWLRAYLRFRMDPLHEDLYVYRYHSGSLTSLRADEIVQNTTKLILEFLPQMDRINESIRAKGYWHAATIFSQHRDLNATCEALINVLKCEPSLAAVRQSVYLLALALLGEYGAKLVFGPYRSIKRLVIYCFTKMI